MIRAPLLSRVRRARKSSFAYSASSLKIILTHGEPAGFPVPSQAQLSASAGVSCGAESFSGIAGA